MIRFSRLLLIVLVAIALAFATPTLLWSKTPKPTVKTPTNVVANSRTYQKVACSTLTALQGPKPALSNSIFPKNAKEGTDYECGYLTVPELHRQPKGKTIQVGIAIIKSTNPQPAEPLLLFQGGPGGSSIGIFPSLFASPDNQDGQRLRADRNLIVFEKRGNRYSKPWLTCPEVKAVENTGNENVDAKAERQAVQTCRDRLTKSRVNLAAFNSLESAHDVATLVKALGYKQVNLYGVSYGTELVQDIMRQHPEIIRSVIMDGIVPSNPSIDSQYAVIINRLINQIDSACANDPDCNSQYPRVKATFEETFNRLNQTPAAIQVFRPKASPKQERLNGFDLVNTLFQMAYTSGAPFVMPALIHQAHAGDFSLIAQNADLTELVSLAGDDSADGTYLSVKCSEDVAYIGSLAVNGVSPVAKAWGTKQFQELVDQCKIWNVPALDSANRNPVVSDRPALLFNGDFDPITPPPYGKLVAKGLRNSTTVLFSANGHGAIVSGACSINIMAEFLKNPQQSPNTSCATEQKVIFITRKNTLIAPGTTWLTRSLLNFNLDDILKRLLLLGWLMLFPVVWFLSWLIVRFIRKQRPDRPTPTGARWAPWLGVLLALLSVSWIVLQIVEVGLTALTGGHGELGYTRIFVGVDRAVAWVYVIPILMALLSVAMAYLAVQSWKQHYWGRGRRFYYSLTAGVAIAYTLFLAVAGQLTVFFY